MGGDAAGRRKPTPPPSSESAGVASYLTSTFSAASVRTTTTALPSSVPSSATCEASPTHLPWRPQIVSPPGTAYGSTTLITWLVPVDNQKVPWNCRGDSISQALSAEPLKFYAVV